MATIEERAHQYGCNAAGGHYQGGMRGAVYDANKSAYIEIATEQHKIDVEKACEFTEKAIEQWNEQFRHRTYQLDKDGCLRNLRKAMEG